MSNTEFSFARVMKGNEVRLPFYTEQHLIYLPTYLQMSSSRRSTYIPS